MIDTVMFLDFETHYDPKNSYTLRTMSPPEYILDDRFENIMCATAIDAGPQCIVEGPDFPSWLGQFDPAKTLTVTYNSLFDNSILAWRYGFLPAMMCDTMNLARTLHGHELRDMKLATVAKQLLGRTKGAAIHKVQGMHRQDIKADTVLWEEFCDYAREDNEQNRMIFNNLYRQLPKPERKVMDLVLRAAVQPQFILDRKKLAQYLMKLRIDKAKLIVDLLPEKMTDAYIDAKIEHLARDPDEMKRAIKASGIMSPTGFGTALRKYGIEPEMKISGATGREIPAFAKTDLFMAKLQEHPDFRVQALAAARLQCKSTLEETRCARLLKIASLNWPAIPGCPSGALLPIALRYGGAHTHRLSGDWGLNMQNLTRKSILRQCLLAGSGNVVIVADLAQIEARLVAWIVKQQDLLATFSRPGKKGDPYSAFATKIFGYPVDRKLKELDEQGIEWHPFEVHGFIGKVGVLGLGYGCGAPKFYLMVETSARMFGVPIDGSKGVLFTMKFAQEVVDTYRKEYDKISGGWSILNFILRHIWTGGLGSQMFGPCKISRGTVEGPGGLQMRYAKPRFERRQMRDGAFKDGHWYDYGRFTHSIYGSMFLENIIQFIARIILMNIALRLNDRGYRFAQQAHDELAFIVPLEKLDAAKKLIYEEFTRPPTWALDLPLDAEVNSGPSYGEAKS